jgi:anti-sigma B factor antagonist
VRAIPFEAGTTVSIAGELDIATTRPVRDALEAAGDAVVVDLTDVTFMDSTGLGVLLAFERSLRERGGRMTIACPEGPARLIFDVTGVDKQIRLYGSLDAAQAAIAAGG